MLKLAQNLISKYRLAETFYITNLDVVDKKITEWYNTMPSVSPHYAVKCNPNIEIIRTMINRGMGFDCASKNEIKTVLDLGVRPEQIIYAHPVKAIPDLQFASDAGIQYTTFDSISELHKLALYAPKMKCLLRLKVDNPSARVQLGLKYGATIDECKDLLQIAKQLELQIVGVSFHVGSASKDPIVFNNGIKLSRQVFNYANTCGFTPNILDIGGGFSKDNYDICAHVINKSLQENNFNIPGIKIWSEPGRYFVEEAMTFFVNVLGCRQRQGIYEYWLNDGLYGSFNCIIYDQQQPSFQVVRNPLLENYDTEDELKPSKIYFCTCDSFDVFGEVSLPLLRSSDYLMVPNFGAYTIAGAKNFNGINMANPTMFYIKNGNILTRSENI
jgi:ornithine decarboxylase